MKHIFSKKNRALLSELVKTDFKLRYQGSVLGYAWSLLRPLLLFIILYMVFIRLLRIGASIPHAPVYLLLGIVIWNFFFEMTARSTTAIVERGDLIRKIRIPRWMIILSTSVSALVNLFLNLVVVVIFLFINHVDLLITTLWLPLILLEVYILAIGCSLVLSATFVRYRDVTYIWEVVLQGGFYLTPILYQLTIIHKLAYQKLIMLNPMAQSIQDARYAVVTHKTTTIYNVFGESWWKFTPFVITFVVLVFGIVYFKKRAPYFAEDV